MGGCRGRLHGSFRRTWSGCIFPSRRGGGDGESCFCVTSFVRLLLHLCCTFILHWCCTCYYYIVIVIVLFLLLLYSCCTVFVCALCSSWYCGFLGRWYFGIPWNPLLAWLSRDLTVPGGGSGSRGPPQPEIAELQLLRA